MCLKPTKSIHNNRKTQWKLKTCSSGANRQHISSSVAVAAMALFFMRYML